MVQHAWSLTQASNECGPLQLYDYLQWSDVLQQVPYRTLWPFTVVCRIKHQLRGRRLPQASHYRHLVVPGACRKNTPDTCFAFSLASPTVSKVKVVSLSSRSKDEAIATAPAVPSARWTGDLWRMRLRTTTEINVLWLAVVVKWSLRPRLRAFHRWWCIRNVLYNCAT